MTFTRATQQVTAPNQVYDTIVAEARDNFHGQIFADRVDPRNLRALFTQATNLANKLITDDVEDVDEWRKVYIMAFVYVALEYHVFDKIIGAMESQAGFIDSSKRLLRQTIEEIEPINLDLAETVSRALRSHRVAYDTLDRFAADIGIGGDVQSYMGHRYEGDRRA